MVMCDRIITYTDYGRLMHMLERDILDHIVRPDAMHRLYLILKTSRKTEAEAIDAGTVTMNSKLLIRSLKNGICKQITLVYPDQIYDSESREYNSIYDPLGLAVFGYRQNDIIDFYNNVKIEKPDDKFVIESILFQPESIQLYHL
jgi:hypothetical protein